MILRTPIGRLILFGFAIIFCVRCTTQAYPDDRININQSFINFFNLFIASDTLVFRSSVGTEKKFIVAKIDSSKLNKRGWFINGGAHNRYTCHFRELGSDTIILVRSNEVSVSKAPDSNLNGIVVQFGNLFYNDTILPKLNHDTIVINNKPLTKYYLIKTALAPTSNYDIEELYLSSSMGLFAFKIHSGEIWAMW